MQRIALLRAVRRIDVTVDLIGGNLQVAQLVRAGIVEQALGAEDVRRDKLVATHDRAIDVALGGDVDDAVAALGSTRDVFDGGDITVHEGVARIVGEVGDVLGAPRVRQQVDVDDVQIGVLAQQSADEVRANKPAATRDENALHAT